MAKKRKVIRTIATDMFGRAVVEKPINSKKKGEKNERVCADFLGKITGQKFTRVPASGGMRWINTANAVGDLVCENADYVFPFSVETKHLQKIPFSLRLRSNSIIYTIYAQCKADAERSGRHPMLILRSNGMKAGSYYVYFEGDVADYITEVSSILPQSAGAVDGTRIVGFSSDDLINLVDFEQVVKKFII